MQFLRKLGNVLDKFTGKRLLLLGDFNTAVNSDLDIVSGRPHSRAEITVFKELISSLDITDVWRVFHDTEKEFTWCRYHPFIARRLDYCFADEDILQFCVSCEVVSAPNTDHKAVVLELNNNDFVRGPGYWRFNNSYLRDTQFIEGMNEMLDKFCMQNENEFNGNVDDSWELCKLEIKQFCSDFGKHKACARRNNEISLQSQLQELDHLIKNDVNNTRLQSEILQVKQQLEVIHTEKARGAQVRARVKWIEEGEKNSKYFLTLEKTRSKKNVMTSIKNGRGETLTNQEDVLREQVNFYSTLYSQSTETNDFKEAIGEFMQNSPHPSLEADEAKSCEGLISVTEAGCALKMMKNGSSPGSDGLTIEFMKFFWSKLKSIVTNSFNSSFEAGELSYTQRQGIIVLLHKGKDLARDQLNNWRPITLTNSDYKILAKVLAVRLCGVIGKLVHHDQVGYLKGRNISTVIRTIDDVIEYMNLTQKSGYLLALDYAKAFDSVSKDYLLEAFRTFGFGNQFVNWIRVLGNNVFSSINHGGWISQSFPVSCGIRQGCPFSPLAFILGVAIRIRNSEISGITLPSRKANNEKLKIKQLADDTTLFLHNKADMILSAEILNSFSKFSGLKLNLQKTKSLKIGVSVNDEDIPFETTEKIKILGITFQNDIRARNIEENWKGRIEKMTSLIKSWSARDLSIHGKITIVKSFLVSQFTFVMQSIGLPDKVLTEINRQMYKFIWQRRYVNRKAFEKVKRKTMESDYSEGGLRMINIINMQKCFYLQWAGKLCTSQNENWTYIPIWHLSKMTNDKNVFEINCRSKELKNEKIKSEFWRAVLHTYLDNKTLTSYENVQMHNVCQQPLWNNTLIRYKNRMLFFDTWKNAGIEKFSDLIHVNEIRLYTAQEIQGKINRNFANIFFEFNALMNALPDEWKQWVQNKTINVNVIHASEPEAKDFNTKPKNIMKILQKKKEDSQGMKPCACGFWLRKFGIEITDKVWLTACNATKEIRLRELHWKIVHNIYPTNILLNKMKVTDNDKCSLCVLETDYIEHFFFECDPVRMFWKKVEDYLQHVINKKVNITLANVLFGMHNSDLDPKQNSVANHVILVGKMCISMVKKCQLKTPIYLVFEQQIRYRKVEIKPN